METKDQHEEKPDNNPKKADPDEILEKLNSLLEYLKNPMFPLK